MKISAIAINVIREAVRQKIIYVTVLFAFLLFAIEPMIPTFRVGLRMQLFSDIALGIAYLAIAIIAIAVSVNQVPGEIDRRTIYNVFSKPVRRADFLVGKYLGILAVIVACAILMGTAIAGFVYIYFGKLSLGIFQGVVMMGLEAAILSAFALLMSTFVSPVVNVFACILFYFVGHVKNDALAGAMESSGAAKTIALALKYLLPSLENFNVSEPAARGITIKTSFMVESLLYSAIFSAVFLAVASLALSRKEL
ncbi:MAG: ABC transporter permease [Firmicutes bacterium]|nr:ABC transporter permease [Bacillota bacterium]